MNPNQIIQVPLAQFMGMQMPQPHEEPPVLKQLDPQIIHTREQLRSLFETINCAETLTKVPDRPQDDAGNQPTVMVSEKHSADSASAIIMAASNRMIAIINDDSRWKNAPGGIEKSKKDKARSDFEDDTAAMEKRQDLEERKHKLAMQKRIESARVNAYCRDIRKNGLPASQSQEG